MKNPEWELHVVGVRLRIVGSGLFDMTLSDLDDIQSLTLVPFTLSATTRIEPTRLANFQSQRVRFGGSVNVIDEYFVINRIILYSKPVAVEYPM